MHALDPVRILDFGRGPEEAVLRTREGEKVWVSLARNNRQAEEILERLRDDPDPPDWDRILPEIRPGPAAFEP